jgi:ribosome-associated toxin RatA of RatAB toxin-antitoxin module
VSPDREHRTAHEIEITARADVVYGVIARPVRWPHYFTPTVHVERDRLEAGAERLKIWATGNGSVRVWTSLRTLDEERRVITFRQEVSAPPIRSMSGSWTVLPAANGRVRLVLTHEFEAVDDDPAGIEWITKVTNENSDAELANVKQLAESWDRLNELEFSFEDSVRVRGRAGDVYAFLHDADLWPERLPHVAKLELQEDAGGVQLMSMWTRAKDDSTHLTTSARVCFPDRRIVYKQLVPPTLLAAHVGEWVIEPDEDGVTVCSRHVVRLNEEALGTLPAAGGTVESTRDFVQSATSANSKATLRLAREYAEGR